MRFRTFVVSVYLLILSLTAFIACDSSQKELKPEIRTPLGVLVEVTPDNSPKPTAPELDTIDFALSRLFADARALGYQNGLEHRLYRVVLSSECEPSPNQKIPSFRIMANNYDGTVYDTYNTLGEETDKTEIERGFVYKKDGIGIIHASEIADSESNTLPLTGTLCRDDARLPETVRYFAEHYLLKLNDPQKYRETLTHVTGGHPLIQETR